MNLWVVIPHHSRGDLLRRAVAAVASERVLVVDDSPQGGVPVDAELLRTSGEDMEVLRTSGEIGFARAANQGIAWAHAAGATHVLLLNDDAWPRPGAIDALKAAWSPGVGAVGPVLWTPDHRVESAGVVVRPWGRLRQRVDIPSAITQVDALSGACVMFGADERLDPAYRHGMEDIDLCLRLRRRGLRVLLQPASHCDHAGGATVGRATTRAQRHAVAGHLRLVGGGVRTPVVVGLAMAQVLRERGGWRRAMAVVQGWLDWSKQG